MTESTPITPHVPTREIYSGRPDAASALIPVTTFIERHGITNTEVSEALHAFPTLCYLLGEISEPQPTEDARPDGVMRPVRYLLDGSGMFGLEYPDDAMRWRGIFNHIMGTARQVAYLSDKLSNLSSGQKQEFAQAGVDAASFDEIDPDLLIAFMFVSHAGRRQVDERSWHGLDDQVHKQEDSGQATIAHLKASNASPIFLELMRVETHTHLVAATADTTPLATDNILTYCDWTYGQRPQTLASRFEGLRAGKRQEIGILNRLEQLGGNFENAVKKILGEQVLEKMSNAKYTFEEQIRRAYCAPSGISIQQAFPQYVEQFSLSI